MEKFTLDVGRGGANWVDVCVPSIRSSASCLVENLPSAGVMPHMTKSLMISTGDVVPSMVQVSDARFAELFKSLKPRTEMVFEMRVDMGRVSLVKTWERYH